MAAQIYPPIDLTAQKAGSSTIDLNWQNPLGAQSGGENILIYRSPNDSTYTLIATLYENDQSYSDTTCGDGTLYYYKARGRNNLPTVYSSYSNTTHATTTLPAPTNLAGAADSTTQITLTWEDNSTSETGFMVYMKKQGGSYSQLGSTTAQNIETYVATSLSVSTLYYFKVRAINDTTVDVYSLYSNEISVTTNDPAVSPITLTNTGHQDIKIIDTVGMTIIKSPIIIIPPTVTAADVLTNTFDVLATDEAIHKIDTTHADNTYPVSSYIRTKDLDFTDQHPDIAGMTKTIRKFRLIYEDIDASTPVTVYISNDGGVNWSASSATVGTGDGRVKVQDFYFMNSEYVTGLNFTFKVDSLSTSTTFLWLAFEVDFFVRGEHFNV